jgi:hypothetical protein
MVVSTDLDLFHITDDPAEVIDLLRAHHVEGDAQ